MTNLQAILLGTVQGLTEYLPVSSSAHLVLVPKILGWHLRPDESFVFNVLVQLGTVVGVIIYFFVPLKKVFKSLLKGILIKDPLHDEYSQIGFMVALATIPASLFGLAFRDHLKQFFSSPLITCFCLMVTGALLFLCESLSKAIKDRPKKSDAILIGISQCAALMPGISRSGTTMAAGMACGLYRKSAATFSFLMAIPIMLGASFIATLDLLANADLMYHLAWPLFLGFFSAAFSGYLVIKWFMNYLATNKLTWFSYYCMIVGIIGAFYFSAQATS